MRKKLYNLLQSSNYDVTMMVIIVISLIPLAVKGTNKLIAVIDLIAAIIFTIDYLIRLLTADYKLNRGALSFVLYPFTAMAIIDFLTILPFISFFIMLNRGLRVLRVFRLIRTFRIFRLFKTFRYSKNIELIYNVISNQRDSLSIVFVMAAGYVCVSAMIVFNVEPETFPTFLDALYWATVSLTTIGYGDICVTSSIGKVITMISAFFGVAIVALPSGIITAGYMQEVEKRKNT